MKCYDLIEYLAMQKARKAALGIMQNEAEIDAMRNKGASRTQGKCDLLRRADERAVAAGQLSIKSYY